MTIGSLFAGIGVADLAAQNLGLEVKWQLDNDKHCLKLLNIRFPDVPKQEDIRDEWSRNELTPVDIIVGGDPCQSRSGAKGGYKSRYPDLSGYFLAVVGRLRPRWVVRENVSASDVVSFKLSLEALGYAAVIIQLDSKDFTAQSRRRQFVIGSLEHTVERLEKAFCNAAGPGWNNKTSREEKKTVAACLTAHPLRYSESDNLVYEKGRGLRLLAAEEREALQGLPRGWTAGFSFFRRGVMLGNAMTYDVILWILKVILNFEVKNAKNGTTSALCIKDKKRPQVHVMWRDNT